ncbi:chemotaxis protein CheB [Mesorhizobium sp. NBSH29]|uniref:chemotaxis protein CheB n=1 Tax=Mesorhizobium sp. NBSH29 TaxID=2654249 RepID=UPI0021561646|nr:chemotaxis protein CheB [Mesorhizobium sp. NBSH29]
MASSSIIVIGASAGGVGALRFLAAALPNTFPAPVLVVLHIGAHRSELPELLNSAGPLPAKHAEDGETIHPGRIYVAPPDRHMIVADGRLRLLRGPKENCARPAIDPLFRSAAEHYGTDALGVILSGNLNDGTLACLKSSGAAASRLPKLPTTPHIRTCRKAPAHVALDYCPPLAEMPNC